MNPHLRRVFDRFDEHEIAIVGSAVRDYDTANDVDVLVLSDQWADLIHETGVKYSGWDEFDGKTRIHIRRTTIRIAGVDKPVQLLSYSTIRRFEDWPYAVLLRSGRVLNEGQYFTKTKQTKRWYPRTSR